MAGAGEDDLAGHRESWDRSASWDSASGWEPWDAADGDAGADPAYPSTTPPDPSYPCHTRGPLGAPLDGIALPATWSRMERPLERTLRELWDALGLFERGRPERQVTLHYGRVCLSAHTWARLTSALRDEPVDRALVAPPHGRLGRVIDAAERLRVRWRARSFAARLEELDAAGRTLLRRLAEREPGDLDTLELARGPLHERAWADLLWPWLGARLAGAEGPESSVLVRAGIALEQRFAGELGGRLCSVGTLHAPEDVAYLTVHERLRAVHEPSRVWSELVQTRRERVEGFLDVDVPLEFWGRPRVDPAKTR